MGQSHGSSEAHTTTAVPSEYPPGFLRGVEESYMWLLSPDDLHPNYTDTLGAGPELKGPFVHGSFFGQNLKGSLSLKYVFDCPCSVLITAAAGTSRSLLGDLMEKNYNMGSLFRCNYLAGLQV